MKWSNAVGKKVLLLSRYFLSQDPSQCAIIYRTLRLVVNWAMGISSRIEVSSNWKIYWNDAASLITYVSHSCCFKLLARLHP